jgi:hypothetical protein
MDNFVVFLETVARRRWAQSVDSDAATAASSPIDYPMDEQADKEDQIAVWNTLLELYLTLPAPESVDSNEKKRSPDVMRDKALRVLKNESIPYDPMHALILCSSHGYTPGLVLPWEKMGMYEDIL